METLGGVIMQPYIDEQFLKFISIIYRKTQVYLNEKVAKYGLTSGQVPFIMITCEHGKIGQSCFCELLDMNKSTVAKMLIKLEAEGYVTREIKETDSRSYNICATQKAMEIFPVLKEIGEEWSSYLSKGMTEIEKAIYFQMMENVSTRAIDFFHE